MTYVVVLPGTDVVIRDGLTLKAAKELAKVHGYEVLNENGKKIEVKKN